MPLEAGQRTHTLGMWLLPLMLSIRAYYALRSPVADCDETFNYWEPAHFLTYGRGLQTWEYSPDFGLRSWLYVMAYSWVGNVGTALGATRMDVFFATRLTIALVSTLIDYDCARAAEARFGTRVAGIFAVCLTASTGCVMASFNFLPSSFALLCLTVAAAQQMRFDAATHRPLFYAFAAVVVGVILGWPFIGLLAIPLGLDALRVYGILTPLASLAALIPSVAYAVYAVDTSFYARPVMSTLEIVKYNVLGCLPYQQVPPDAWASGGGGGSVVDRALEAIGCVRDTTGARGSHLYGVEPPTFFFKNLFLNFNVAFVLAIAAPLCLLFEAALVRRGGVLPRLWATLPFYTWFVFWLFIPHKEERFMVPAYGTLCLAAAVGLDAATAVVAGGATSTTGKHVPAGGIRGGAAAGLCGLVLLVFSGLSASRTHALTVHYAAPTEIMKAVAALPQSGGAGTPDARPVLCFGRDWYRFMSHYFVPDGLRVAFIDDGFEGLLPTHFETAATAPPHMNDLNRAHPAQFTPASQCTYLFASEYPSDPADRPRPSTTGEWRVLAAAPLLDTAATPLAHRTFALPAGVVPGAAVYGKLMLLQRV